jgi:hypothetical protein
MAHGVRSLIVLRIITILDLGQIGTLLGGNDGRRIDHLHLRRRDLDRLGRTSDDGQCLIDVVLVDELLKDLECHLTCSRAVHATVALFQRTAERLGAQQVLGLAALSKRKQLQCILEELLCHLLGNEALVLLVVVVPHFLDGSIDLLVLVVIDILLVGVGCWNLALLDRLLELLGRDDRGTVSRWIDGFTEIDGFGVIGSHVDDVQQTTLLAIKGMWQIKYAGNATVTLCNGGGVW